ncbi:hypothetical protein [Halanaerobacter jeridensis]|uniref:Uncharacterized protein n=1 Tax=Halanaerobacter jeridensis TaxID=706427 RepID=A0A938XQS2_9FIRM|nr:hypothetical protein [Halanaerobacter jeridensis]MBM7558223.1 hypothetical protein [Halanaerobacter jeridensis]
MSKCGYCESPERKIWPPINGSPNLKELKVGNWITLLECGSCNTLWCEVHYEPYGSFRYLIIWDLTKEDWIKLYNLDNGEILKKWHAQQIRLLWKELSEKEQNAIRNHRKRSNGINPIDKSTEEEIPDLKELI